MKHLFLLILFLFTLSLAAAEIIGKVVGVADGDTITVLEESEKRSFRIRFFGIDCPEKKQAFGNVAKKHLSYLIFGKTVKVVYKEVDIYGRIVGKVFLDGTDINLEMLKAGLAWHYKRYDNTPEYAEAESQAKRKKIGLWQQPNPIPPWKFRRKN